MTRITLLAPDGGISSVPLLGPAGHARPSRALESRVAYAAVHVVPRVAADNTPGRPADIDWDATLEVRRRVSSWGLGVADAMDTAQRNMGLDAAAIRDLIAQSAAVSRETGGSLVVGVNTDELDQDHATLEEIIAAYTRQQEFAENHGAGVVMMASRHLARAARSADDYRRVYRAVLAEASSPVVLHWLGPAFDPELRGYFGSDDTAEAADVVASIIEENQDRVAGIKMSLLDAEAERSLRRRLPSPVKMFTGDDFHYVGLIGGDDIGLDDHHSHALLGAFAAIAPHASAAIQALDADDPVRFLEILGPTEELSRHLFAAPTFYYKTGIAFLSWLNGFQPAFQMVGGLHASRSLPHLSRVVELANGCGALEDPDLALSRWHALLRVNGVELARGMP
jgi:hypothetical protein